MDPVELAKVVSGEAGQSLHSTIDSQIIRFSKRKMNYEIDSMEDSVFVEPFKIQDKTDVTNPDQSLLYQEASQMTMAGDVQGDARFSVSFAKDGVGQDTR
jgi:hypothetical protein